jgi:hypothetical protein
MGLKAGTQGGIKAQIKGKHYSPSLGFTGTGPVDSAGADIFWENNNSYTT